MRQREARGLFHLRRAGVSVVISLGEQARSLPQVVFWGADLGELDDDQLDAAVGAVTTRVHDDLDAVNQDLSVLPAFERGWMGRPGVAGSREGRDWSPAFRADGWELSESGSRLSVRAADDAVGLSALVALELLDSGLLRGRVTLVNDAARAPYRLDAVRLALPVPAEATELLDLTGRWSKERVPQRRAFTLGIHARESRQGRPGLDAPLLLIAGEAGFGFRHGRVWALHVAHSGNHELYAEATSDGGRVLAGGELLLPGEVDLAPGEAYEGPWVYGSTGDGLDEMSARFHDYIRSQAAPVARKVVVNTWEAVYFRHDVAKLKELASRAAAIGAERFVLDDGWFGLRRDDAHGLGDWTVSPDLWPHGLTELIAHVHDVGMDFGLWVEPEMVNLDSDLVRAHPEWVMRTSGRLSYPTRHQYGLDLTHPAAFDHVLARLDDVLTDNDIAFLKWDHNRPLVEAGHSPGGEAVTHGQVLATHRLMETLKRRHPGLEIESCASGGGRVDLGILPHVDRFWASDCNDPVERTDINRYTQLLLPPELIGAHVGPSPSHTTGRNHSIAFSAATAFWCHLGVELDLTELGDDETAQLRRWVDFHKRHRALIHTGTVVNCEVADPAWVVHGVVSTSRDRALFSVTSLARPTVWPPPPLRLVGLDPDAEYRVAAHVETSAISGRGPMPGWAVDGAVLKGSVLGGTGLQALAAYPETSYFISLSPVDRRVPISR